MDMIRRGTTEKLSESVQLGSTIYLSGKLPTDLVPDIRVQAVSVLDNVEKALQRANSDKDHIVSAQVFLKHRADADVFNSVWNQWFSPGCAPARICVEANMLNDQVLVEVSVVAAAK